MKPISFFQFICEFKIKIKLKRALVLIFFTGLFKIIFD